MNSAAEIRAHYAAVRNRIYAPRGIVDKGIVSPTSRTQEKSARRVIIRGRPTPDEMPRLNNEPWRQIVRDVCSKHGVDVGKVLSTRLDRGYVLICGEFYYRIRTELKVNDRPPSLKSIEKWFSRNHSTIINAMRKYCSYQGLEYPAMEYVPQPKKQPKPKVPADEVISAIQQIDEIVASVCLRHGEPMDEVLKNRSSKRLWRVTGEFYYLIRTRVLIDGKPPSFSFLAKKFDRPHTTLIDVIRRYCTHAGVDYPSTERP